MYDELGFVSVSNYITVNNFPSRFIIVCSVDIPHTTVLSTAIPTASIRTVAKLHSTQSPKGNFIILLWMLNKFFILCAFTFSFENIFCFFLIQKMIC